MDATSLLCRDAGERERLLDMSRRLRPAKRRSMALVAGAALVSIPVYGWAWQVPFLLAAGAFALVQTRIERLRRPEYALAATWLLAQVAITVAILLTPGPRIYTLSILVLPMLLAAAVFPRRIVAVGAAITAALMLAVAIVAVPSAVQAMPPVVIFPIVLVLVISLVAARLTGADEDSRQSVIVDQLTGVLNRAALQARALELAQHLGGAGTAQVAMILCDVDHFKRVNDEHGHAAGDAVLVEVARRLTGVVGPNGSLYRFGGEEFIVLLEGSGAAGAQDLGERMRIAVRRDVVAGLPLTLSVGVALSAPQTRDYAALLASADRALYQAKAAGRDRVHLIANLDGDPLIPSAEAEGAADRRQRSAAPPSLGVPSVLDPASARASTDRRDPREQVAAGARRSFIRTSGEREHLLDMTARITEIAKTANPLVLVALLASTPWLGWTLLIPIVAGVTAVLVINLALLPHFEYPEYPGMVGVVLVLLGSGVALLLAHHQPLFMLPLVAILLFGHAAALPAPAAAGVAAMTGAVMTADALLIGAHQVLDNPSILVFPLALLGAIAIFGHAIGQSTVDHRAAAAIDPLTGTLTRAALRSRVAELAHRSDVASEPVALLLADLDHFKAINDEHGHPTGDRVLVEVVERLRRCVRVFDSVYRIGGEEFVVLLADLEEPAAASIAERIRVAVSERPIAGLPVTLSIGVAALPADAAFDYEQLFASADAALLAAKTSGRDRVLTSPVQYSVAA